MFTVKRVEPDRRRWWRLIWYYTVVIQVIWRSGFSKISHFLELILMEHIDTKNSLDSKLHIYFICSIGIRSRNWVVQVCFQAAFCNFAIFRLEIYLVLYWIQQPKISQILLFHWIVWYKKLLTKDIDLLNSAWKEMVLLFRISKFITSSINGLTNLF